MSNINGLSISPKGSPRDFQKLETRRIAKSRTRSRPPLSLQIFHERKGAVPSRVEAWTTPRKFFLRQKGDRDEADRRPDNAALMIRAVLWISFFMALDALVFRYVGLT